MSDRDDMLLQEYYGSQDPWKLLVCCVLLNHTTRVQVDAVLNAGLFDRWPNAEDLAGAEFEEVQDFIKVLGLQTRRARTLITMSNEWVELSRMSYWPPTEQDVATMTGVGDYACESYCFFVLRDYGHFRSGDKELKIWLKGLEGRHIQDILGQRTWTYPEWLAKIEEGW